VPAQCQCPYSTSTSIFFCIYVICEVPVVCVGLGSHSWPIFPLAPIYPFAKKKEACGLRGVLCRSCWQGLCAVLHACNVSESEGAKWPDSDRLRSAPGAGHGIIGVQVQLLSTVQRGLTSHTQDMKSVGALPRSQAVSVPCAGAVAQFRWRHVKSSV